MDDFGGSLGFTAGLVGRDVEMDFLLKTSENTIISKAEDSHLSETGASSEFVFVKGSAGTGKTALIEEFKKRLDSKCEKDLNRYLYVAAAADETSASEPFSTMILVLEDLCSQLLTRPEKELKRIRSNLNEAMAGEGQLLVNMVPSLEELVGPQPEVRESATSLLALNRFKFVFQSFFTAVSKPESPIVVFIDDLQWIDSASMDLINLFTIEKLRHFMFIGAYRSDETDEAHHVPQTIETLRSSGARCTVLEVENLDHEEVEQLVARVFREKDVSGTVDVIYKKSGGNPFHIMALLHVMKNKKVLSFSEEARVWSCDIQQLKTEIEKEGSVVVLLRSRLSSFKPEIQHILHVASFLPIKFEIGLLQSVLESLGTCLSRQDLAALLDEAVLNGVLSNTIGSTQYSFPDKRLQKAAMDTISEHDRNNMALRIGRTFGSLYETSGESWMLFHAADHLNSLSFYVEDNRSFLEMVRINLSAGEQSVQVAAFAPASVYLRYAIAAIERDSGRWHSHYDLCIKLYSLAADVEFTIGSFSKANAYANEVVQNSKTLDDKLEAYLAMSNGYEQRERHVDAQSIGVKCLNTLGEMPRGPYLFQALRQLSATKKRLVKMRDEDFLLIPRALDKEKIHAMKVLANVAKSSFFCGDKFLSVCATLRIVKLTLKYGLCPASAIAFSSYAGFLCAVFDDLKEGKRMNAIALQIARLIDAKEYEANILFNVAAYIDAWTEPLPRSLETFNRAYRAGCEAGDLTMGILCLTGYNLYSMAAGLPLGPIADDCKHIKSMIKIYDIASVSSLFDSFFNMVIDLTEDNAKYQSLDESGDPAFTKKPNPSLTYRLIWLYLARLQVAYYFGRFDIAERAAKRLDEYTDLDPSFCTTVLSITFGGLVATARYRETKQSKYRRHAKKKLDAMTKLLRQDKGLNCLHKFYLLRADFDSTFPGKKDDNMIRERFDEAIGAAARSGYLQDSGIASELAGEFFIEKQDLFWARHYFSNAYRTFESWGAEAKVKQLLRNRGSFIDKEQSGSSRMRASRKARVELTQEIVEMHSTLDPTRKLPKALSSSSSTRFGSSFGTTESFRESFSKDSSSAFLQEHGGSTTLSSTRRDSSASASMISDSSISTISQSVVSKPSKAKARIEFASREISRIREAAAKAQQGTTVISGKTQGTAVTGPIDEEESVS